MIETELHKQFRRLDRMAQALVDRAQTSTFPPKDARDAFLFNAATHLWVNCISLGFELGASQLHGQQTHDDVIDATVRLFGQPLSPAVSAAYSGTDTLENYRRRQRRDLFIDVWCAFEDPLRAIYDVVVPAAIQARDRSRGHVTIYATWHGIATQCANHAAVTQHWPTVDFWAAARNTIHSNTFYKGPNKQLELTPGHVIHLIDGKHTNFHTPWQLPLMIDRLEGAWESLRFGLASHTTLIPTLAGALPPY